MANPTAIHHVIQEGRYYTYVGNQRYYLTTLDHRWQFDVQPGTENTFHVEAHRNDNNEGDDFMFHYSTNDTTYHYLTTVNSSTEEVYSVVLPNSLSGTVYIRAWDTDLTLSPSWVGLTRDLVAKPEPYIVLSLVLLGIEGVNCDDVEVVLGISGEIATENAVSGCTVPVLTIIVERYTRCPIERGQVGEDGKIFRW